MQHIFKRFIFYLEPIFNHVSQAHLNSVFPQLYYTDLVTFNINVCKIEILTHHHLKIRRLI